MSPETARAVRQMLQLAAGPGGTAPKAQAVGYSVGGKTGTARKQEGKGYTNKYRAWFVGLAPVSNPRIVVAVMVDEPGKGVYFGGDVAAPVFSQVVQQTLRMMGVPPDIEVKPGIVAKPVPGGAGKLLMAALLRPRRRALLRSVVARLRTDSRQVRPGDAFIAWPGTPPTAAASSARRWRPVPRLCLVEAEGPRPSASTTRASLALPGLKAATGRIAALVPRRPSAGSTWWPPPAPTARPPPRGGRRRR
jgi:membrane peptidoglycan carboxypeptidase